MSANESAAGRSLYLDRDLSVVEGLDLDLAADCDLCAGRRGGRVVVVNVSDRDLESMSMKHSK